MRGLTLLAALLPLAAAFSFQADGELDENSTALAARAFSAVAGTDLVTKYGFVVEIKSGTTKLGLGVAYNKKYIVTLASIITPAIVAAETENKLLTIVLTSTSVASATAGQAPSAPETRTSRKVYAQYDAALVATNKFKSPIALILICPSITTTGLFVPPASFGTAMPAGATDLKILVPDATNIVNLATRTVAEDCECDSETLFTAAAPAASVFCIRASADFADAAKFWLGAPLYDITASKVIGLDLGPGSDATKAQVGLQLFNAAINTYIESIANPASG